MPRGGRANNHHKETAAVDWWTTATLPLNHDENDNTGSRMPSHHILVPNADDDNNEATAADHRGHHTAATAPDLVSLYQSRASMEMDGDDENDNDNDNDAANNDGAGGRVIMMGGSYCCGLRLDTTLSRALAWDMMARSMIGMSSVYLGPALLDLAGSSGSNDMGNGKKKIWGTSPGAILTNLAAVSGLLGCIFLPLAGSILDHTSYRRAVGYYSAVVLWSLKGMEIFLLRPSTWLWLLPMQVILAIAFNIHLMAVYAYVAELSSDPSVQAGYNAAFGIVLYLASLFLLVGVLIGSALLSTDDTGTAQIALAMTTFACLVGFGISWGSNITGFPDRPALHPVIPPHQNIATAGYRKLAATIQSATKPARSVLLAVAFGEAARSALISVSTTVMKVTLQMSADEIGMVFLAVLLAGIPGNKLGEWLTKRSRNPVWSIGLCNIWFMASTAGAALVLHGPDQKHHAPFFGALWGIAMGWLSPAHTSAFVPLIPAGCNAEWMGFYILATSVLSWLPPAVFSVLHELGWSMAVGLMSLNVFLAAAMVCLRQVGHFAHAVDAVQSANAAAGGSGGTAGQRHELT